MPAGYALARMGYKATLSLAKGKENLKISKMTKEEQTAICALKNLPIIDEE